MSDKNETQSFMDEMSSFLNFSENGGSTQFQRPNCPLKLKKEKKSKKEKKKKEKKEKKRKSDKINEPDMWMESETVKSTTTSWLGVDKEILPEMGEFLNSKQRKDKKKDLSTAELDLDKIGSEAAPSAAYRIKPDVPQIKQRHSAEDLKVEQNKLAGQLLRAELRGDKNKISRIKARLDEIRELEVPESSKRHNPFMPKENDANSLVKRQRASEAALMKAVEKNILRGGGLNELFDKTTTTILDDGRELRTESIRTESKIRSMENCRFCYDNKKLSNSIVAEGETIYIAVTGNEPMTEGHCLIIPKEHYANLPSVPSDVAADILSWRRKLTEMWKLEDKEPIFLTNSSRKNRMPHFVTECVPIDISECEFAPMYFQKAFQDVEGNWAQNKAVVNTMKDQSHYKKVPSQLGHVAVEFGGGGGFAHVVENSENFPTYFMREILGGLLDLPPAKWRKPKLDEEAEIIHRAERLEKQITENVK